MTEMESRYLAVGFGWKLESSPSQKDLGRQSVFRHNLKRLNSIDLDDPALKAFNALKNILSSFSRTSQNLSIQLLTSTYANGPVISQV